MAGANNLQTGGRKQRDYQICTRCIMDTTDPEITFDENGYCNHCVQYYQRAVNEVFSEAEGEAILQSIVAKIKQEGKGKEYDCIIGVSGGVDSTAVAYHVKKLGLRPLALHLDNGWDSELAVDNVKRLLDTLEIDLYTHVIDWEEFRDLQLSFLKASVANCEIPTDHAINALLVRTAQERKIRYIITGGNLATEGILPAAWGYYNLDLKHLKALHKRFGSVKLKTFPQLSLLRFLYSVFIQRVRYIPVLNYLNYNKAEAKELIKTLGWRDYGGKHFESIYTRFFQSYILPKKFGYDKRRAHLSTLICSGQISREDALAEMLEDPYKGGDLQQDREYVIKKLGLTEEEFDKLMAAPVKEHTEYPSNNFFFHEAQQLKRVFKRVATRA